MNERPKSARPIDLYEYPDLQSSYSGVLNYGSCLTLLCTIVPGYLIYFGLFSVPAWLGIENLAATCVICSTRYLDLQRFDGVSGDVYITVALASLVCTFLLASALTLTYAYARRNARKHIPLKVGAGRQVAMFAVLLVLLGAGLIFIPTELSTTNYPGSAQLLAGSTYPILAGFNAICSSLAIANIGVFCLKIVKF